MLSLTEFVDKFLGKAAPPSGRKKATRVGELGQDVDAHDMDDVTRRCSQGSLMRKRCSRRWHAMYQGLWSSTT